MKSLLVSCKKFEEITLRSFETLKSSCEGQSYFGKTDLVSFKPGWLEEIQGMLLIAMSMSTAAERFSYF